MKICGMTFVVRQFSIFFLRAIIKTLFLLPTIPRLLQAAAQIENAITSQCLYRTWSFHWFHAV